MRHDRERGFGGDGAMKNGKGGDHAYDDDGDPSPSRLSADIQHVRACARMPDTT
ncbi:hypothetical protein [Mycobacteroides sp. LB1]|uniref:hypothetical protein n=1 Tax=Mycobacteroides sp. LB1 TaxID=2750814 RepID=UPI0015DF8550|nr:hypothetical protein [Mycobacteroides sp. LB1]